jgi:23S rRNA (guanosine2251-2'-O)-methyltransferase
MKDWISGRNPVYETLRAGRRQFFSLQIAQGVQVKGRLEEILRICDQRKIPIQLVPREQLERRFPGSQGVALEASGYPYSDLVEQLALAEQRGEAPFLLILDALQDPQNLGTLLRTAEGVGVQGVLLPLRHSATVTPAVAHASSGASEHLLITQTNLAQAIATLKREGLWIIGLEGGQGAQLPGQVRLDGPLALVVGSEAEGMRSLVRQSCDSLLRLPMRGRIESLNAAVAGSVALYMIWQARSFIGFSS